MKISVLIIAHNEEKYIGKCIESVLNQIKKADEIVLLLHNSTDETLLIAQKYPITIISWNAGNQPCDARIEGLRHISGDIILCTDGDSFAEKNWIEVLSLLLEKGNILVGSWVKFQGTFYSSLANLWNRYFCVSKGKKATRFIWGSSMAFWGKDKEKVREIFVESIKCAKELNLSMIAEDYQLALAMVKKGNIEVTNKTFVTAVEKEKSSFKAHLRSNENLKNGAKIRKALNL